MIPESLGSEGGQSLVRTEVWVQTGFCTWTAWFLAPWDNGLLPLRLCPVRQPVHTPVLSRPLHWSACPRGCLFCGDCLIFSVDLSFVLTLVDCWPCRVVLLRNCFVYLIPLLFPINFKVNLAISESS